MLFVPFFQGTEPAHIYFLTLPKILHTLQKCVQGPCTPCWQLISGRINRARTVYCVLLESTGNINQLVWDQSSRRC